MNYSGSSYLRATALFIALGVSSFHAFADVIERSDVYLEEHSTPDFSEALTTAQPKKKENFFRHLKQKRQTYKLRRNEAKFYHQEYQIYIKRNAEHFPETWQVVNDIAFFASKMIEKHYDGIASIRAGAQCLRELSDHWQDKEALLAIRANCEYELTTFKKYERVKHLSDDAISRLHADLINIFPNNPDLIKIIHASLDADMRCTVRGGSMSAAWFFGANMGAYRLKCTTPLGRRMLYVKGNVQALLGWGVDATMRVPKYVELDGRALERTYRVPMDSHAYKAGFVTNTGGALGIGANINPRVSLKQGHTDTSDKTYETGAGLGFHLGAGLGNLIKVKDIFPDFRDLFFVLGLGFD